MPRRISSRKTKTKRKATRKATRRSRVMCGGVSLGVGVGISETSCAVEGVVPENVVVIPEDTLKIARPDQSICYGDVFTTCLSFTVVMENKWKVGVHINPTSYKKQTNGNATIPEQKITPFNLLQKVKETLDTDEHFRGQKIKAVYLLSALNSIWTTGVYGMNYSFRSYKNNIHNNISSEAIEASENEATNTQQGPKQFKDKDEVLGFLQHNFGDRLIEHPLVEFEVGIEVEHMKRKNEHFKVKEDGSLDLVSQGKTIQH